MRKKVLLSRVFAITLGMAMMVGMTACGKSSNTSGKISDYVKLGDYKKLSVDLTVKTITDADVEDKIQNDLKDNAKNEEVKDRKVVQDADIVNINTTATVDGADFTDASADDNDYTLGTKEYGENFDKGIVGKNVGDTFDLTVTLPEDYSDSTKAGKEAKFNITINSIKKEVVPEFNDAFVASISDDCKTTDEYREFVKNDLQKSADEDNENSAKEDLMSQAVSNAKVKGCPDSLYNLYFNQMTNDYTNYAQQWGMDFDSFLSQYMGMDEKGFKDYVLSQTYDIEVAKTIAKKENINVSSKEYKKNLKDLVENNGWDSVDQLEEAYSKEYLENNMVRDEVLDFLYKNAKITKVPEEETTAAPQETTSAEETTTAAQ